MEVSGQLQSTASLSTVPIKLEATVPRRQSERGQREKYRPCRESNHCRAACSQLLYRLRRINEISTK
jgi:hypothetical protein